VKNERQQIDTELKQLTKEIKQMQKELRGYRSNFLINKEIQAQKRKYGSFSY